MRFRFALDRRSFVQILGGGVLLRRLVRRCLPSGGTVGEVAVDFLAVAPVALSARFHFADDGTIGCFPERSMRGQGRACELAQAAAEELRVPLSMIRMTLGDTGILPERRDDCRQRHDAANRARRAAGGRGRSADARRVGRRRSGRSSPDEVEVHDGKIMHAASKRARFRMSKRRRITNWPKSLRSRPPSGAKVTPRRSGRP